MTAEVAGERTRRGAGRRVLPDPVERREHPCLPAHARPRACERTDEVELGQQVRVRLQPGDLALGGEHDVRVADAVVIDLDRKLRGCDAERSEQLRRALVWLNGRHGLSHAAEDDSPGLVSLELDRDDAVARLERDHAQLERRAKDERSAEARVPGEQNLVPRREDADPNRAPLARRKHEDRLGEPKLERQLLHREVVEVAGVGEDGELVARKRPVGEDIGEDVAKRTHRSQTTGASYDRHSMRLFLVRHAHSDPGDPDSLRPLSARGRQEARELAERLAPRAPDTVLASPLLRARETAAAITKAAGVDLRIDERLAPGATAEDVLAAVEGAGERVVVVGHQPDCSEIALALGVGDRDFAPAAFAEIELA